MKKDNAGFRDKLRLRREALKEVAPDAENRRLVVLEAYAGEGHIGRELYSSASPGVALEKNERKAGRLARERPAWRVYECDSVKALAAGLASDVPFNLVDLDPYGSPWPCVDALFAHGRRMADRLVIAVNDGLRQHVRIGRAWRGHDLHDAVARFGNDLHDVYLEVCRYMMQNKADQAGYDMIGFRGFYAGHTRLMTHYYAVLTRR